MKWKGSTLSTRVLHGAEGAVRVPASQGRAATAVGVFFENNGFSRLRNNVGVDRWGRRLFKKCVRFVKHNLGAAGSILRNNNICVGNDNSRGLQIVGVGGWRGRRLGVNVNVDVRCSNSKVRWKNVVNYLHLSSLPYFFLEGLQTSCNCAVSNVGCASNVGNRNVLRFQGKHKPVHLFISLGVRVAGRHSVAVEASFGGKLA